MIPQQTEPNCYVSYLPKSQTRKNLDYFLLLACLSPPPPPPFPGFVVSPAKANIPLFLQVDFPE